MIDVVKFSTAFTAFWSSATPMCEHFVRKLNLNLYDRVDAPMPSSTTESRAFIAEFGFALFVELRTSPYAGVGPDERSQVAERLARRKIELLQGVDQIPAEISTDQTREANEIARRLASFFYIGGPKLVCRPTFPGCGFIDRSEGDVLFGSTLFEIKTVSRNFRGSDIRQLVAYCALNALSNEHAIQSVGLFNPRSGISFSADVESVCREISGKSHNDLFEEIYQAISSGGVSR